MWSHHPKRAHLIHREVPPLHRGDTTSFGFASQLARLLLHTVVEETEKPPVSRIEADTGA